MEEILFWVIDCRECHCLFVEDHVEEAEDGSIVCPKCYTNSNIWVQGFDKSVFDHFSEEACLKIHDALTTPSHRFIERHIVQGMQLKKDLKKLVRETDKAILFELDGEEICIPKEE